MKQGALRPKCAPSRGLAMGTARHVFRSNRASQLVWIDFPVEGARSFGSLAPTSHRHPTNHQSPITNHL
ncbi:MAG: hypothetical protein WAM44_20370, partial [Chthoniobacterales bacterium]